MTKYVLFNHHKTFPRYPWQSLHRPIFFFPLHIIASVLNHYINIILSHIQYYEVKSLNIDYEILKYCNIKIIAYASLPL